MGKYLVQFSYTEEGLKGLLKEGGTKRQEAVAKFVASLGGKLEVFYYAFGQYDGIAIVDGLDNVSESTASMVLNSSGAVKVHTTVLLTPEEVDQATQKTATYRPPGK